MENSGLNIESIYDQYYRDVYHFALFYTNNKQEAEDITQETFIKVMKNMDKVKDLSKLKVWILSITKHTAIDLKRKQKFLSFLPDWRMETEMEPSTPERKLMEKGDWAHIQKALLQLKPHYRTIIILRGLKELSVRETAEILWCSERKVRVDRFLAAIKKILVKIILQKNIQQEKTQQRLVLIRFLIKSLHIKKYMLRLHSQQA